MRRLSSLRCRLGGVILLLVLGGGIVPERSQHLLARADSRASIAPAPRLDPPIAREALPADQWCARRPAFAYDTSRADARWERHVQRIAGRHRVGIAVGIGGRLAFTHNAGRPRVPASNQKLLLSLALLDHFRPDHRIPTSAWTSRFGSGTVAGDLWVVGRGDPTLTAAEPGYWGALEATTLATLARRIRRAGVTEIEGSVRGATTYLAHDFDAPGWQPYVPGRYVQLPSALVINGNNTVRRHPEKAVAAALTKQLEKIGVRVSGAPGAGVPPERLERVAKMHSRPLREIVSYMNQWSNNFFAEVLGKGLGASVVGPPGTIRKGARVIARWVREHGERAIARDSSGLSYRNRISPRAVVRLLGDAGDETWGRAVRTSLPAAGEGTLRNRLQGIDVRAKTGSLFNGASALSGWVRSTRSGRWVEFSIIGRDTPKAIEDRIVRAISTASIHVPRTDRRHCEAPREASDDTPDGAQTHSIPAAESMRIRWRHSKALGTYTAGRLIRGVQLPSEGRHFFTWDPVTRSTPNRGFRRFATDRLLRTVLGVLRAHAAAHPGAPRIGIGDLSRRHGGDFGPQFGGIGHASHQNGLDADIYYPRRDGRERRARHPRAIDRVLAQDLVDRFVRAGAVYVFVGPRTGLTGPPRIVQPLPHHDDHMHVRLRGR